MKTVTIPESEYTKMQHTINELQTKLSLLQDSDFLNKLMLAYKYFVTSTQPDLKSTISLERGSCKDIITHIANDFTAPVDDFKEYM